MAVEDRIQAAVEQQVASACAGHSQELDAVCQQLQQTLDRRMQVCTHPTWAHAHMMSCCEVEAVIDLAV